METDLFDFAYIPDWYGQLEELEGMVLPEDSLGRFAVYSGKRYLIIRTKFEKFVDESSAI